MTQVSYDLQSLEIETFAVESLEGLGVNAACGSAAALSKMHGADVCISTTSSTTSSSCG